MKERYNRQNRAEKWDKPQERMKTYVNMMYCKIKLSMSLGYMCFLEIKTLEARMVD